MPMMGLLDADVSFPTFTGQESEAEKTEKILNYLYMLIENLRYTLGNLDEENFSEGGIEEIGKVIREPLYMRLEGAEGAISELNIAADVLEGKITSAEGDITKIRADVNGFNTTVSNLEGKVTSITQTVEKLELTASNSENTSTITLTSNGTVISSASVKITGFVTLSDLAGTGTTTINGANIVSGTITGTTFRSLYNDGIAGSFECYFTDHYEGYYNILSGRIYSYFNTDPNGNKIPALYISASENYYVDCALKLLSSAGTSIESGGTVYIESGGGHGITLTADEDGSGDIRLNGNVYINGVLIS